MARSGNVAGLGLFLAAGAACLMAAAPAAAVAPPVLSGPTPFSGCNLRGEQGRNYLNAEVEPWVDVNPSDPSHLVAGWQQDRWSNGGSRSLLSAYSVDGGQKWQRVVVPGINKCSGGKGDFAYDRSSDPWVAVSPNGTAYFMSLSFNNDLPSGGSGPNAMLVSQSVNDGASWSNPVVLLRDTDKRYFNDKNALTADPRDSHYVYAAWDRLYDSLGASSDEKEGEPDAVSQGHIDGVAAALQRLRAKRAATASGVAPAEEEFYSGPAWFARTIDGGRSWEPARMIYDPGRNAQTIANQPVVLNDGSVLVFFTDIFESGETRIRFVKSTDHGGTFSAPVDAAFTTVTLEGTRTPDLKKSVRDGNILFDVAVDRATGRLYLVWQDGRQDGVDRVAFAMSGDGGASWSAPAIISKTPANRNLLRTQAFVPSVEVGADSRVYVTYYDFRNDRRGKKPAELVDYWAISCDAGAGCSNPAAWGRETRLTSKSFNILNAPFAGGYFLGDYQGLVRQDSAVRAVFGVAAPKRGQTAIVTQTVR